MSPAPKLRELQQDDFDRLLRWLDPDRERAGMLYEKIRWRLVAILAARGCPAAEEMADETIDRVSRRVADIKDAYVGEPAIYFLGVMNNVHHEFLKRPVTPKLAPSAQDDQSSEQVHSCLDQCLDRLAPHARELIQRYYAEDKQAKITLRRTIARQLGVSPSNLRLRALRIRSKLQDCINQCLDMSASEN